MSLDESKATHSANLNLVKIFKVLGFVGIAFSAAIAIAALIFIITFKPEGFGGLGFVPVLLIFFARFITSAFIAAFFFLLSAQGKEGLISQKKMIIQAIFIPLLAVGLLLSFPSLIFPGDSQGERAWNELEGHQEEILSNLPPVERPQAAATVGFVLDTVHRMSWKDARAVKMAIYQWYGSQGSVPESSRSRTAIQALDQVAKRNRELPRMHMRGVSIPPDTSTPPPLDSSSTQSNTR